jgi:hypothetical protein
MWANLGWGLPYLVVVVTGALVCAFAGPRGPGTARWRVPGAVGFALLGLQHLLQTAQTVMLYRGAAPGGWFGSPWYLLVNGLSGLLTLVGLLLVAVAVVRGRGPTGHLRAPSADPARAPEPGPADG